MAPMGPFEDVLSRQKDSPEHLLTAPEKFWKKKIKKKKLLQKNQKFVPLSPPLPYV